MTVVDKRPIRKPTTFADIRVGTLFSPSNHADIICMKTGWYGLDEIEINSVDLSTGILYRFEFEDEIVPIDNYEFNIL